MVHWLCQVGSKILGQPRITRNLSVKQSRILGDDQPMMSIGLKMEDCLPPNSLYYTTDEENHDEASKFGGTICQTNLCGWWLAVWHSKCLQPLKPRDHPKHGFCLIQKSPNMISLPRFLCQDCLELKCWFYQAKLWDLWTQSPKSPKPCHVSLENHGFFCRSLFSRLQSESRGPPDVWTYAGMLNV